MAATTWKTFSAHALRTGKGSGKEILKEASSDWRGLKGVASGRTRRNPAGLSIPKIVLYAGGAYLIDRFVLGGQIMNTITGIIQPKPSLVLTGGTPPTSGL